MNKMKCCECGPWHGYQGTDYLYSQNFIFFVANERAQ
jgi:hypothetical protein